MKTCSDCKIEKVLSEFHKSSTTKDKLRPNCKVCRKIERHQYYLNNRERTLQKTKEYAENNKDWHRNYQNEYSKNRRREDVNFRISGNLRTRIPNAIAGKVRSGHTIDLLGCSINELKIWLQRSFTLEMNWENYGSYWEIDHIRPCASFDLSKPDEQKHCFNYTNLQPLTINQNRVKNDSYEEIVKGQ